MLRSPEAAPRRDRGEGVLHMDRDWCGHLPSSLSRGGSTARARRVVYLATQLSRIGSLCSDRSGCTTRTLANCTSECTFQDIRGARPDGRPVSGRGGRAWLMLSRRGALHGDGAKRGARGPLDHEGAGDRRHYLGQNASRGRGQKRESPHPARQARQERRPRCAGGIHGCARHELPDRRSARAPGAAYAPQPVRRRTAACGIAGRSLSSPPGLRSSGITRTVRTMGSICSPPTGMLTRSCCRTASACRLSSRWHLSSSRGWTWSPSGRR